MIERPIPGNLRSVFRRFARRDDGGMIILSLLFFVMMVMVGGMAVDLMRYENSRTELQQTLDRSILAAASLKQVRDPEAVVTEYFEKAGLEDELISVDASPALDSRVVSAEAASNVETIFMHMIDVESLMAPAAGRAEESVSNIEISLVLDISGSMREGNQIGKLRTAAKSFFSQVLDDDAKDTTSINIVPYAGHVNVGPKLFSRFGANRTHNDSSCIELTAADYTTAAAPPPGRGQVPHFMQWAIAPEFMNWGWCPMDNSPIIVAQNDLIELNTYIDNIRLHDGTGTMTGTKYGLMLLNPDLQPTFAALAADGDISNGFADRPLDWQTSVGSDVTKYLIVMTDGQITDQYRPKYTAFRDADGDDNDNEKIDNGKDKYKKTIYVDDPDDADGTDHATWNATVELLNQPAGNRTGTYSSRATNLTRFYAQCDLAKSNGVIVYTIAFNAPASAKTEMKNCASSLSYYYEVPSSDDGTAIKNAFTSIARNIKQLRLTQ